MCYCNISVYWGLNVNICNSVCATISWILDFKRMSSKKSCEFCHSHQLCNKISHTFVQCFREMQIMVCVQHRQLNANYIFLGFLIPGTWCQVASNYIIIDFVRGCSQTPLSVFVICVYLSLLAFCAMGLSIYFMSLVYKESKDISKQVAAQTKTKYLRRFVMLCNPIKVHFGDSGNFFEQDTSLNVEQYSLDQTINFLLA